MEMGFWKKLKKPIMVQAPMSGVSDEAFRLMLLKYGSPDAFWTEFVSVDGLFSRGKDYCLGVLKHSNKLKPIVAQFFGSVPENFEKAAKMAKELGFDGIDINMGCPDRNIGKTGAGADLIKNHKLAVEIIRATKRGAAAASAKASASQEIPVSVKTRIGYKKNEIKEWISVILEEKPAVLTVHFRTKEQMYAPPANWELAKDIVKIRDKISPKTLIFGNGDVASLKQAKELAKKYKLDGIMVGRGLLGNPWFFYGKEPDLKERLSAIVEHAEIFNNLYNKKSWDRLKKHFHSYAKNFRGSKELRESLMKTKNVEDVKKTIVDFLSNLC